VDEAVTEVDDERLTIAMLEGLQRLAGHARDGAAAGGNVTVRALLVPIPALTGSGSIRLTDSRSYRGTFGEPRGEAEGPVSAEAVAPLEQLAAAGPVVVETAAALLGDIEQSFGIPELEQLTRDGRIRINHWQESNQPALRRWAEQHGVELTEERLPSQG
jgi:hypothetical protein